MIRQTTRRQPKSTQADDLSGFSCPNGACADFGKCGGNNLRVDFCYGKTLSVRLLYCRTCRTRFSERKGSLLEGAQLSAEKVAMLYAYLDQGKGVRETARLMHLSRNTVLRYKRLRRMSRELEPEVVTR